ALDAHRETGPGGGLPDLPTHAAARALPPSRLHLSAPARLPAHAGILSAGVESLRGFGRRGPGSARGGPVGMTRCEWDGRPPPEQETSWLPRNVRDPGHRALQRQRRPREVLG